jgi:hypothetical protein
LKQVADFKEKEKKLENSNDRNVDESAFDKIYSKLPTRDDPQTVANQKIYTLVDNGKFPGYC